MQCVDNGNGLKVVCMRVYVHSSLKCHNVNNLIDQFRKFAVKLNDANRQITLHIHQQCDVDVSNQTHQIESTLIVFSRSV